MRPCPRRASGYPPRDSGRAGFSLLETVCVMAIVGLLAALALPAIPRGTPPAKLEAYAIAAAAVLKADRNAAIRRGRRVTTTIDARGRRVQSGASQRIVHLPEDVGFDVVLASRCGGQESRGAIAFFPSGMSCGGTLVLSRLGTKVEVHVTWLTGGVEVTRPKFS